jgi:predicted HTH transcriptional regulator
MEISKISQLPRDEDDHCEFKSSLTLPAELEPKLQRAVSAFANSGGGIFVAGVNDKTGDADGGLTVERFKGNQPLLEWVDQMIALVKPTPVYQIKPVDDPDGRGTIDAGKAVLVVSVKESYIGPHMAPDHRYYIRAGRNTVPAPHFIVEAIWAMRHFSKPRLTRNFSITP